MRNEHKLTPNFAFRITPPFPIHLPPINPVLINITHTSTVEGSGSVSHSIFFRFYTVLPTHIFSKLYLCRAPSISACCGSFFFARQILFFHAAYYCQSVCNYPITQTHPCRHMCALCHGFGNASIAAQAHAFVHQRICKVAPRDHRLLPGTTESISLHS